MKNIYILLISIIILTGCKTTEKVESTELDSASIKKLIVRASEGFESANDSLSGLFDLNLSNVSSYNSLKIDSFKTPSNKNLFFVLLEYPNPVYNRFAAYDENLKCYLIDKSLNGQLSQKIIKINGNDFVEINEGFLTKDIIQISRISLYRISNDSVALAFRDYTRIELPTREYSQIIKEFSNNQIRTLINGSRDGYVSKEDIFTFDKSSGTYESEINMFDALVKYLVSNYEHETKNPRIIGKE